jgi:DNA-binding FadR family transcriptional regulator
MHLERVTAMESLIRHIEAQVLAGDLRPGDKLPGEAALANEYGVSRPVVREALSQLRERGYLNTINGSGTYVRHPDSSTISSAIERHLAFSDENRITVDHLYEAREAIEVSSARLAAKRANLEQLALLKDHLEEMRDGRSDRARYAAADMAFHIGVARASGNPLLPSLLTPLVQTIIRGIRASHSTPQGVDLGLAMHAAVLDCLVAQDPEGAARAMTQHLSDSRRLFPEEVLVSLDSEIDGQ